MRVKRHVFMVAAWHVTAITTLVTAFAFVGLIAWWSLQPLKPIITLPNGIKVEPNTVKAGETTYLVYEYCKNATVKRGEVKRYLKDNLVYFLPTLQSNVDVGCKHYRIPLEIPKSIPTDTYTYNAEITYEVNPIKTKTYYFQSETFKVVNDKL